MLFLLYGTFTIQRRLISSFYIPARSDQLSPSNHSLWKMCSRSAKEIKIWKGNHDRFNDARHHAKMPYIPTHDSLYALKYLNPKQSTFPNRMIDLFSEIKLEWHILPNKDLSRWWADARLNDDEWRHNNLAKSLKARAPDFNVVEMLRLAQIVLENKLFPDPIKMYVTEPSESQSPSSVHSSSSNDEDFSNGKSRNYYHSSRNKHAVKRKHPWPSFSWNPDSGSDGDSSMNKVPSRRNKRPKTKSSAKGNRNDALLGSIHEALGAIHIALGAINNALSAIQGNKNNTVGSVDASDDGMSG